MAQSVTQPQPMRQDLSGRIAVVTGGSKGIGRAIGINLARRGCSILATCSTVESIALIDEWAKSVHAQYNSDDSTSPAPGVVGCVADISSPDCANVIADGLFKEFNGNVDIFVNNAAITGNSKIGTIDAEHVQKFCVGNIQTPTLIVNELVRQKMFRKNSRIILISSERSKKSDAKAGMYCATKAAGEALVRCWADAFGGKDPELDFMAGTTANSIFTGVTKTEAVTRHDPAVVEKMSNDFIAMQSLPRIADPEDVADVVGLLCTEGARWITGSLVSADGGGVKIC